MQQSKKSLTNKVNKSDNKTSVNSSSSLLSSLTAFVGRDMGICLLFGITTGVSVLLITSLLAGLNAANPPIVTGLVITLFFTLKFLFAPLVDKLPAPFFGKKFGHRRGMAMLLQILVILSLVVMMLVRKLAGWPALAVGSVAVVIAGFQIMVLDGLRVEMLSAKRQAHGITLSVIGYFLLSVCIGIIGPWLAKAGIEIILLFAIVQIICLWGIIITPSLGQEQKFSFGSLVAPFVDIFSNKKILMLLPLLLLYKYGNSLMVLLSTNFYNGLGFQGEEQIKIAVNIVQNIGPLTAIVGIILGAIIIYTQGLYRALLVGVALCMIAPIFYPIMLRVGPNFAMLFTTVAIANISTAVSTLALVVAIAVMLNPKHSVTQWAFLTSVAAFTCLPSLTMLPTITTLPLITQYLLTVPVGWLLQVFKVASPDVIALTMILLSLPGLFLVMANKNNIKR